MILPKPCRECHKSSYDCIDCEHRQAKLRAEKQYQNRKRKIRTIQGEKIMYGVLSRDRWFLYKGNDRDIAEGVFKKEKNAELLIQILEEKK